MKTKIKILFGSFALVAGLFAFSPLFNSGLHLAPSAKAQVIDCGDPKLHPDPNTGVCVPFTTTSATSINGILIKIINILLSIAGTIAILFIIWGGFQYITSAGNSEKAESGRNTLVNAVIGLAIVILAFTIVGIVNNTVSGCFGGFFGGLIGGC